MHKALLGFTPAFGKKGLRYFMTNSYDPVKENSKRAMICLRCRAELIPMPEPEAGDWIIRCLECGVKNLVTMGLRIVAWRF